MITVFDRGFLIHFYLFPAKNFAEFFSDDHQGLEGFLNGFGNALDEGVVGKDIFGFGNGSSLEHLLPDLVWRHKEAYADGFYWNILSFECYVAEFSFDVLLHSCDELVNVGLVEGELGVFFAFVKIGNGMVMEPDFEKVHKYLSTGCVGFK